CFCFSFIIYTISYKLSTKLPRCQKEVQKGLEIRSSPRSARLAGRVRDASPIPTQVEQLTPSLLYRQSWRNFLIQNGRTRVLQAIRKSSSTRKLRKITVRSGG